MIRFIIQNIPLLTMQRQPTESQILEDYLSDREQQETSESLMKKSYLKQNILDLYTDEEERIDEFLQFFLVFLRKAKGIDTKDHDLGYLSLDELKELVRQFHQMYPPSSETDIARAVVGTMDTCELKISLIEGMKEEQFDAQKVYYANGSWDYELVGYEECKQVKEFFSVEEYRNNLAIFQKQEVKKTGGFFGIGGRYELWIEIRSNLFLDNIMRRVEDFIALKNVLSRYFPYVFIYPLEISEKQLEKVNEEAVRNVVVSECRKFINYVCKSQLLLQNINTHRFFKDQNHQSYQNFQKTQIKEPINKLKLIENTDGCVPLEISDKNQLLKKDFIKKGEGLEQIWTRWQQSNTRISNKLKEVQVDIQKQRKEIQKTLLEYTNVNPLLKCNIYEKMIQTMIGYSEVFKNYEENVGNFQFLFDSVNLQVASQSKKIWTYFNKYAKEISQLDHQYHMRRKVFLEKQAKREQAREKSIQGKTNQPNEEKQLDPVNKSIINRLGISSNNSLKETAWIQRFSKWQGYINKQFANSFERLLENDVDILQKILRQNIENRCQMQRKQEQLIKSLQYLR